ncbi:hypothetical protein [Candidatus Desulforudis audaxviator]|uniref:hypothetical protein n=1 Tax=Candidatus Desulforudis audaxviator TaxID=471827 RepID=UPI00140F9217|nr:hypothetical protein [Candidatus Desulforudis audaxviator]
MLENEQYNASPEALDWILDRLATEGFQLVKQLPTDPGGDLRPQGRRSPNRRDRQRIGVDRDPQPTETARSEQNASLPGPDGGDPDLWAEQAMDELLSRAKAGVLHREDLLKIIGTYHLSPFEVEELCGCLRLRGIELLEFDFYEIYQNVSGDGIIDYEFDLYEIYQGDGIIDYEEESGDYGSVESLDRIKPALCPEEAIDKLLFRAEIGLLRDEDILTVIETYRLFEFEVYQLLEYLYSKGVDLPTGYFPWQVSTTKEFIHLRGKNAKEFTHPPTKKFTHRSAK